MWDKVGQIDGHLWDIVRHCGTVKMIHTTVRLPEELLAELISEAMELGVSVGWVIRKRLGDGRDTDDDGGAGRNRDREKRMIHVSEVGDVPKAVFEATAGQKREPSIMAEGFPVSVPQCQYREWSGDLGAQVKCGLPEHGPKTRHGNWRVVG